jgi:uncharacterized membrane protein YhaH (DUF805 family)
MSFTEAIRTVLSKYTTFSGRASRPEFWWWVLFVVLLNVATGIVDATLIAPTLGFEPYEELAGQPLSLIVSLAILLPNISVSVRRLHDIDRSGWWYLIILIPFIGVLVIIYWAVQPGTSGSNRFGV